MKRTVVMIAMAMLVTASVTRAAQETVAAGASSPVKGGTVMKAKTMTAAGAVKSVTADSLAINDGPGKDWTFVIDATTKIVQQAEKINVAPVSPVEGGKVLPSKPQGGAEPIDVAPVSPVEGGKVIPGKSVAITDLKEGQRVQVSYRKVDGKMHATQVRVM